VEAALRDWGCEAVGNAVLLVTSELVTNAIVHGRSSFTLTVTRKDAAVRIAVTDHGPGRPVLRTVGVDAAHGRGLQLVDRLSSAWSSYPTADGGKVVWGEVRLPFSAAR
jgi:anti-sigma regulatory factor (Ser/Thr protein kinase)